MNDITEIVQANGEFVLAFKKELYSSLMSTPPHTRLVFHYLRLLANDGKPRGSVNFPLHIPIDEFLTFHFNIGIDDVRESLRVLSEPDAAKPGQEHEGRRIEIIETPDLHAIRILNWNKYQPERAKGGQYGNKNAAKPAPSQSKRVKQNEPPNELDFKRARDVLIIVQRNLQFWEWKPLGNPNPTAADLEEMRKLREIDKITDADWRNFSLTLSADNDREPFCWAKQVLRPSAVRKKCANGISKFYNMVNHARESYSNASY